MKSIAYFVVGLLIISGFAAISIGEEAGENQEIINLSFNDIEIEDSVEEYIELNYDGADGRLYRTSQPVLPIHTTIMELPFGTEVTNIDCVVGEIHTMTLENKVVPAPTHSIPSDNLDQEIEYTMDETIYNSNELFPNNWFDYHVGVGRNEDKEHVTFLNIRTYPVRYNPNQDEIQFVEDVQLTVTYTAPDDNPFPSTAQYDLVIIAPQKFVSDLNKLVTHKNGKGVQTLLKTTNDIYTEYSGVDKPEKIKYFIKDALETYDMSYVLLIGGLDSILYGNPKDDINQGSKDWWVPVRYTNNRETGGTFDPGFISDLYYADIYKEGGEFDDWDSNDDGIFAKWSNTPGKDILDFYPDVYVGRLACRNTLEVKIMVNKIINYEKNAAGASWYDKIILAGGDSFEAPGYEGEIVCERVADDYMSEFNQVKLYASNKDSNPTMTPTATNIIREIKKGAGHLFLDGHASPFSWTTHWPNEHHGEDSWTERFMVFDFYKMWNFKKLPICAVEGCHNSQFNVSILTAIRDEDNSAKTWCYGLAIPECWSWWMTRKIGGGSLATIGNTGLGYGAVGEHGDLDGDGITEPDILEKLGGFYFDQFYQVFDEGAIILGDVHSGALNNYLDVHPGMDYQADAKTMQQMALLGDPSLKIGGYTSGNQFTAEIVDAAAGVLAEPGEEVAFQADSSNGQGQITYEWDLDNDGSYDDAEGESAFWSWNLPGVSWVSVKATDGAGKTDTYDTIVAIKYGASKPSIPAGPTSIKAGVKYSYSGTVNTQSGYWNKVFYKFSWGDGSETDWLETSSASHYWTIQGNYKVKVKALLAHESVNIDESDFEDSKETEWSDPLTVTLPRTRSSHTSLLQLILNFFERHTNMFPILEYILGI